MAKYSLFSLKILRVLCSCLSATQYLFRLKLELLKYHEGSYSKNIFNWTKCVYQSQLQKYFPDLDDKILVLLWMFREFSHASNLLFHRIITYCISDFREFYYCAASVHCIIFYTMEKWHIFRKKKEKYAYLCVHTIITEVFILLIVK